MQLTCDGCEGFFDIEMHAIEHKALRKTGYVRIVGKSISEHPSRTHLPKTVFGG